MTTHYFRLFLLIGLLLSAAPATADSPAAAEPCATTSAVGDGRASVSPVLLADGVSVGKWLSGGRGRVVQLCVVAMCVALFIMMKKLK